MANQTEAKAAVVYSYHTFLFMFLYADDGRVSKERFENMLASGAWKRADWNDAQMPKITENVDIQSEDDVRLAYQEYQYFNKNARRALYNLGSGVMSRWTFKPEYVRNKGAYIIQKGNGKNATYRLVLNGVKLRVYNTGVAVMILETENRAYPDMGDIKRINEYGRRINAPFTTDDQSQLLCADLLGVEIDGDTMLDSLASRFTRRENNNGELPQTYVASFILSLLTYENKARVTLTSYEDKRNLKKKTWFIEPVIDDRMTVCCLIADEAYCKKTLGPREHDAPAFACEQSAMDDLYELAFIDKEGCCTCPNREMLQSLFKNHLYTRWVSCETQTVYAITHHSLVCVTGNREAREYDVIRPFLTSYVDMFILTLVQRASIIAFSHRAARITDGVERPGRSIKGEKKNRLMNLQEAYIAFQNQFQFFEVTPQEQGVELYAMMREALYIPQEKDELEKQFTDLYEVTTVNQNDVFNKVALILALSSIFLALATLLNQIATSAKDSHTYAVDNLSNQWQYAVIWAAVSIITGVLYALWFKRGKR